MTGMDQSKKLKKVGDFLETNHSIYHLGLLRSLTKKEEKGKDNRISCHCQHILMKRVHIRQVLMIVCWNSKDQRGNKDLNYTILNIFMEAQMMREKRWLENQTKSVFKLIRFHTWRVVHGSNHLILLPRFPLSLLPGPRRRRLAYDNSNAPNRCSMMRRSIFVNLMRTVVRDARNN